jgi:uncharacterized damage-inducible protein DinB
MDSGVGLKTGIAPLYEGWSRANRRIIDRVRELPPEALNWRATADSWPVWAMVAHAAMVRVYWLCDVLKEPGAETTPFTNARDEGWEDHLDQPRGAAELINALEVTWRIVESCLERWSPAMLEEAFERQRDSRVESHTRGSVLTRLISHDGYHSGEVSLILGMHGLDPIDLWRLDESPSR